MINVLSVVGIIKQSALKQIEKGREWVKQNSILERGLRVRVPSSADIIITVTIVLSYISFLRTIL